MTRRIKVPVRSDAIWVVAPVEAARRERVIEPYPGSDPVQNDVKTLANPSAHSSRLGEIG